MNMIKKTIVINGNDFKEKISKNSIINKQQKAFVNTNLLCYNRNNYFKEVSVCLICLRYYRVY